VYSYPNAIPLRPAQVRSLRAAIPSVEFEDVFGYSCARNIIGDARRAVDRSFTRYLAAVDESIRVTSITAETAVSYP
jgi:hypothetical protein